MRMYWSIAIGVSGAQDRTGHAIKVCSRVSFVHRTRYTPGASSSTLLVVDKTTRGTHAMRTCIFIAHWYEPYTPYTVYTNK